MSVAGSQTTVDDTSGGTVLHTSDSGISGTNLVIKNADATEVVALGPPGVTFANGFKLVAVTTINFFMPGGDILHGICDTGKTVVVHILKAGE